MIELTVYRFETASLCKQRISQDLRVANRLSLEYPTDTDKPLFLLRSPVTAGYGPLHAVFNPCLIRHQWVANRSLAHETDDVGGDIGITRPSIGLAEIGFREAVLIKQYRQRFQ